MSSKSVSRSTARGGAPRTLRRSSKTANAAGVKPAAFESLRIACSAGGAGVAIRPVADGLEPAVVVLDPVRAVGAFAVRIVGHGAVDDGREADAVTDLEANLGAVVEERRVEAR